MTCQTLSRPKNPVAKACIHNDENAKDSRWQHTSDHIIIVCYYKTGQINEFKKLPVKDFPVSLYREQFRRDSLVWQTDGQTDGPTDTVANGALSYVANSQLLQGCSENISVQSHFVVCRQGHARPCKSFTVLRRVRNCQRYYYQIRRNQAVTENITYNAMTLF